MGSISTFSPGRENYGKYFSLSTSFVGVQTDIPLIASPGSAASIYISGVSFFAGTSAGSIYIEQSPSGTDSFVVEPVSLAANASFVTKFDPPLKVTTGSSLTITTEQFTGRHGVIITGYTY